MAFIEAIRDPLIVPAFSDFIGAEGEGWVPEGQMDVHENVRGGKWTGEAGLNMVEAVTQPLPTLSEVFQVLHSLDESNQGVEYTPFRPSRFDHNKNCWKPDPRYKNLKRALEKEKPGHQHLVNAMTNNASFQLNLSGKRINPFGDDGVYLVNFFNNVAPWLAHQAHRDINTGYGHLAIWKNFALKGRLPDWSRWFRSAEGMIAFIESFTPLFRKTEDGELINYPKDLRQSIKIPTDLTFQWWFVRPKISPEGIFYLEIRYLPSMPLHQLQHHVSRMVDVVDHALYWFHEINKGKPVRFLEDAVPVYTFLANEMPSMPGSPLEESEWKKLVEEHEWR